MGIIGLTGVIANDSIVLVDLRTDFEKLAVHKEAIFELQIQTKASSSHYNSNGVGLLPTAMSGGDDHF